MRIGHSSIDERNQGKGGTAGDQTGKEVCIRSYYDKNWNYILRPKSSDLAEKSAKACEAMCNNSHIGYDKNERNDLILYLEKLNWEYKKIEKNTECDCSSFMTACALCGGAKIEYKGNAPTTRTMRSRFKESGAYDVIQFISPKHNSLKRGDILVKEGSHTVMVLDDYIPDTVSIAPVGMPVLKEGSKGEYVRIAQGRLVVKGYPLKVDGEFGPKTKETVKQFQLDHRLKTDGIIGSKTWTELYK